MNYESPSILIVDDDELNRAITVHLLAKEGYLNFDMAENGYVALEKIRKNNYDAILLDVEMPELSGFGVLEYLKNDIRLMDIPVIMISGIKESEIVVKCIELGAEDYLHKPIDPILLRARLSACLEKKRLRDQKLVYTSQLRDEKKRSDDLLNVILPAVAANELKSTGKVPPRSYQNVGILFCDIVNFTLFCDNRPAVEVISGLQNLFEAFEGITKRHGLEKIKTIGDAFMASSGLMLANEEPLLSAVSCGLEMIDAAACNQPKWEVRIGISQGPVIAGIVGHDRYQFDVWGDTVNTASRMTDIAKSGTIVMPTKVWMPIHEDCDARSLGQIEVKGKGRIELVEVYALRPSRAESYALEQPTSSLGVTI